MKGKQFHLFVIASIILIMPLAFGCTQSTPPAIGDPEVWLPQYLCGDYEPIEGDTIWETILEIPGLLEVPGAADNWNQSYGYSQKFFPLGDRVNMSYAFVVINSTLLNDANPPEGSQYFAVYVLSAVYGEYTTTILLRDNMTLMPDCGDTRKPLSLPDTESLVGADMCYNPTPGFYYEFTQIEQGWVVFEVPDDFVPDGTKLIVFYDYEYGVSGAWNL